MKTAAPARTTERATWEKPALTKLGTIADVAGAQTPFAQASNVKS